MTTFARGLALCVLWIGCCAANVPANVRVSVTDGSLSFDHNGTILSTAVICPGLRFDRFGVSGPQLSPDNHWLLVDVIGPFSPGNVPRTHALVQVATGAVVLAPNFPTYLGVPTSLQPIAWASGQRATLAYPNGKSATLREPPLRPIPAERCSAGTSVAPAAAPATLPSATPFPF
ncbi:MAG: hypothetical protein IAI49_05870 [Candidatus Eremiobacteraeota bacterium]|nr:hypothetical protein [Candidatus Eremiobacteraeota bacterium]